MNRWDRVALAAVFVCYGAVDTGTSIIGQTNGLYEGNAVPHMFILELGLVPGLIIHKLLTLIVAVALIAGHWYALDAARSRFEFPNVVWMASRYSLPVTISAVGLALGIWNTALLL